MKLSIHRIFQVFGEGEAESRLWPMLRAAAQAGRDVEMTPGAQIRDFVPAEVVAEQLLRACERQDIIPGIALIENVGSGQPRTVREFAEEWWQRWNGQGRLSFGVKPYRAGEVMRYVPALPPLPS